MIVYFAVENFVRKRSFSKVEKIDLRCQKFNLRNPLVASDARFGFG